MGDTGPVDKAIADRFIETCKIIEESLLALSPQERDRLRRLNMAIAKGSHIDASSLRLEDQILVLLDRSHHCHYLNYLNSACELVRLHYQNLDWDDLTIWADRLNVEWAIPRLRDAVHTL